MFKKILLIILVILIIIQFIHPARNRSTGDQPNNISKAYLVVPDVKAILAKACLDCHSNNTRYRWYFKIQPLDWWLTSHINDGKGELNFVYDKETAWYLALLLHLIIICSLFIYGYQLLTHVFLPRKQVSKLPA